MRCIASILGPGGGGGAPDARGLRTAYLGDCRRHPKAAALAHIAVSMTGEPDLDQRLADVLLLQPSLDLFADLWEGARAHSTHALR